MILVDTSIWIELQRLGQTLQLPEQVQVRLATCGPVIQEVLRGESLARSGQIALPNLAGVSVPNRAL